ncbi:MAG: periplasmic heavy metal sensor [Deltaproteobacteria bacterium]|jgi:Spy/CpxP family protein refolding chaperone|nr:periplasmic heavy metal sensor [Deltaproteobacteria bacterium]MBN2846775.1 periplasmic heavy metal sensor [Deltaproteobacteria bacterium]
MRNYFLIAIIFIFLGSFAPLWAQGSVEEKKDNNAVSESKDCIPLSKMEFSSGQAEAIEAIRSSYRRRILQLRSDLMVKRIEIRNLLNDPETGEEKVLVKAGEIEDLNRAFDRVVLNYQLEIRRVLSPEQIKVWCTSGEMSAKRDWK